nr:Chain C, ip3 [Homo sapiens]6F0G_D Chain D, ip3 [Homo sapiens]
ASTERKWAELARRIRGAGGVTLNGFG